MKKIRIISNHALKDATLQEIEFYISNCEECEHYDKLTEESDGEYHGN